MLAYFNATAISGRTLRFRYERSPDFFRFLRYQGPHAFVFVRRDEGGGIRGVATLSLRRGYIEGELRTVGYLGDFRVSADRDTLRTWRRVYPALLEAAPRLRELDGCEDFLTTVIDENALALNALAAPRARARGFTYTPLVRYRMVNVLGRLPGAARGPGHRVRRAESGEESRIAAFLDQQNRAEPFGFAYAAGELDFRLREWTGLTIDSFLLAERADGSISACLAVWEPSAAKRIVVERVPFGYPLLRAFFYVPRAGELLQVSYLTHVGIADEAAFPALVAHLLDEWRVRGERRLIAFCDFATRRLAPRLRGYIRQSIPMTLYSVQADGRPSRVRGPRPGQGVGFEIATV